MNFASKEQLHVAIVEDNPAHRETYSNMILIDNSDHKVDTYPDAKSLLAVKDSLEQYDCILFDIKLPDMNGIELSKNIRASSPDIPIIFITAYSSDDEALSALSGGAEDYLPKGEYNQTLFMRSIRYAIERKRHQLESARLVSDLNEQKTLNAQQKEFVSMVSHEFRTPLAIIGSSVQLIERQMDDGTKAAHSKHLLKIGNAVKRLTALIDNALCFSKLEEGIIKFSPVQMNLQSVMQEIIDSYGLIYPDFRFELVGDALPAHFSGDRNLLDHIFFNLLSNAVKYSRDTSSEATIKSELTDHQVMLTVIDNGRGIPPEQLKKIGERFFRAENSIGTSGSGIGLHIVKRMVEMHHGTIELTSQLGEGTKVTISLPLTVSEGEE